MKTSVSALFLFSLFLLACWNAQGQNASQKVQAGRNEKSITINDGTKLSYFVEGTGSPIVVVTEGELLANAISNDLKKYFKFIFINARMNVVDPGDINKITFNVLVDDVEQIRKALNLDKVSVLGHSVSGLIALEYARKYPEHTTHVIMNGTPPYSEDRMAPICRQYWETNASNERKEMWNKNWHGISRDSLDKLGTSETGKLLYILDGPQCFYDYNFTASSLLKNVYWNMKVWNQIFKKLLINYEISKGKPINSPVFLALGKSDYLVPYTIWDDQKSKIPNLTCHIFEKSGHYSFFEEEELFRKEILEWFENTKEKK
jgi:proline iminopeptidase